MSAQLAPDPSSTPATSVRTGGSWAVVALAAFGAVSAARLVSALADVSWLARGSQYVLMLALALWVVARRGPVLLLGALVLSGIGDVLLISGDKVFIIGMAFFAAAHVCYVTYFVRAGALRVLRRRLVLIFLYGVVWLGLIAVLWSGLGDLRIPVAAYSLLLTGTALTSAGLGWRTGLGGALFFVSDALIAALTIAQVMHLPAPDLWIMSTYLAGQFLLASGIVARSPRVA